MTWLGLFLVAVSVIGIIVDLDLIRMRRSVARMKREYLEECALRLQGIALVEAQIKREHARAVVDAIKSATLLKQIEGIRNANAIEVRSSWTVN